MGKSKRSSRPTATARTVRSTCVAATLRLRLQPRRVPRSAAPAPVTLLYAYGAYGSITSPYFDPAALAWYERGGVIARAMVRGSAESRLR
jgi:hypothetical protein